MNKRKGSPHTCWLASNRLCQHLSIRHWRRAWQCSGQLGCRLACHCCPVGKCSQWWGVSDDCASVHSDHRQQVRKGRNNLQLSFTWLRIHWFLWRCPAYHWWITREGSCPWAWTTLIASASNVQKVGEVLLGLRSVCLRKYYYYDKSLLLLSFRTYLIMPDSGYHMSIWRDLTVEAFSIRICSTASCWVMNTFFASQVGSVLIFC